METREKDTKILRGLALADAVRGEMDAIVQRAGRTVALLRPQGKRGSDLRENQIRNVMGVAQEAKSAEVVTNFVRYQIGRSVRERQWQYNGFGLQVIRDIEGGAVEQAAARAADAAAKTIGAGGEGAQALKKEAYLELIRHYLGYLNRAFYFCTQMDGAGDEYIQDPWGMVVRAGPPAEEAEQNV
jgi:hypothetical protein